MNRTSLILSAAAMVGLVAPVAQAFTVVPASYVSGVVTAIDADRNTVTVEGQAYTVAPTMLTGVDLGADVTLTLVAMKTVAIDPTALEVEDEIVE
jgi:hypothetical protein